AIEEMQAILRERDTVSNRDFEMARRTRTQSYRGRKDSALFAQWPSYLTFITSFATILIMWASHQGIFRMVYRADTPFLFAYGLLLLFVAVVPFPTSLVAQYLRPPAAELACAVYAGIFVAINVAYNLLWWAATRQHRLLHPAVTPRQVKRLSRQI